ncbi:M23 family metallopeptidase [Arthrobacter sp. RCC_34]|uniref:M23 family metallopeptidase n=1 Tax=Arthrobacter sp. RCC_34 TaxID=3239230 RepID=UPI0035240095
MASLLAALPASAAADTPGEFPGTAVGPVSHWRWPLEHPGRPLRHDVLRPFDPPDQPWLSGHRGVDLRASEGSGAAVLSPADGVVSFRGTVVDRPVITIDHGHGLKSSFEPVESDLKSGDAVRQGQRIGSLRPGHCAVSVCVHWGVRQEDEYVDPLRFIQDLRPSILLPWG